MKILILLSFFLVIPCLAVDGYQDIKFGISYNQLISKNRCTLTRDAVSSEGKLDVYVCSNFRMTADKTVNAVFYFLSNKLLRLALVLGDSSGDFVAFAGALSNKYGPPSSRPSASEISQFDQGKLNTIDLAWVNDTVILRQVRDGDEQLTMVIYSSPSYAIEFTRNKTHGLENAL